jgi:hypothetical protein
MGGQTTLSPSTKYLMSKAFNMFLFSIVTLRVKSNLFKTKSKEGQQYNGELV